MNDSIDYKRRRQILKDEFDLLRIERCVLMTGSFRSGTSYIGALLSQNGLKDVSRESFQGWFGCRDAIEDDFLKSKINDSLSQAVDGLFCCKIMWPHRNDIAVSMGYERKDSLEFSNLFPHAKWINVVRRDKIAQAISFWRAKNSNRWHVYDDRGEPEVEYSFEGIRAAMTELSIHDRLWQQFYDEAGIMPHTVIYEEFEKDPASHTKNIFAYLGDNHRIGSEAISTNVGLRKQRDEKTVALRDRFLNDSFLAGN